MLRVATFRDVVLTRQDDGKAARICEEAGVDFIVTGHTPHREVTSYGGRIFDIDVGMRPMYGGNTPRALVISDTGIAAFQVGRGSAPFITFGQGPAGSLDRKRLSA